MNHFVEASAASHIVKLALASRIDNLWLEGDSLNIINCLIGYAKPLWTIANTIEELKSKLSKFNKTYISHMYKEANLVVDYFANEVIANNVEMTWYVNNIFPIAINNLLLQDCIQGSTRKIQNK